MNTLMNDRNIGMSPDFGRRDDEGPQSVRDAIEEARASFWESTALICAEDFFGDDVVFEAGPDRETIDVYRKHDHKLLSQEWVAPYGEAPEREWEYD